MKKKLGKKEKKKLPLASFHELHTPWDAAETV